MKDKLKLTKYEINKNQIVYFFDAPKKLCKFYKNPDAAHLFIEYPEDCDLSKVPPAVLMVPFVSNMLTMTMLLNISIEVPELDKTFFGSLNKIKAAYKHMFPYIHFNFDVTPGNVVDNKVVEHASSLRSLFFTGGLDATSGLVEVLSLHPQEDLTLINIWGGDIATNDQSAHDSLVSYLENLKQTLNVDYIFIRSNCRELYNERAISRLTALKIRPWHNHGWWASIAHILSMSSLIAPFNYLRGIHCHYISSSYETSSKTFDANNEMMVSAIKFCNCELKSLDKDLDRTQKAKKIVNYCERNNVRFKLKVCWYQRDGENCSHCEKCYRTILDIIVNKGDPNLYGFDVSKDTFKEMRDFLRNNYVNVGYWHPLLNAFKKQEGYWKTQPEMSWILNTKLDGPKAICNKGLQVLGKFKKSYK